MRILVFCLSLFLFLASFSVSHAVELYGLTAPQGRGFGTLAEKIELLPNFSY